MGTVNKGIVLFGLTDSPSTSSSDAGGRHREHDQNAWEIFAEFTQVPDTSTGISGYEKTRADITTYFANFLAKPCIQPKEDPLEWWRAHMPFS